MAVFLGASNCGTRLLIFFLTCQSSNQDLGVLVGRKVNILIRTTACSVFFSLIFVSLLCVLFGFETGSFYGALIVLVLSV